MNRLLIVSIDGLGADAFLDRKHRIPCIRAVADAGSRVDRLKTIFPSVTWPIHCSVVTGCLPARTGIFGNSVYDRVLGRRVSSFDPACALFDEDQKRASLFSALSAKDASIASICWPLTQGASSIRFNVPELYSQEHFERYSSRDLWEELRAAGLPVDRYGEWSASHGLNPLQDSLSLDIASYLFGHRKPEALFLHFLLIDSFQHDFGVGSPEASWAIEFVDGLVGRLLRDLEVLGLLEDCNLILFSDHGHSPTRYAFNVDAWLAERGFGGEPGRGPFIAIGNGGSCFVYSTGATPEEEDRLVRGLRDTRCVGAVWKRGDFEALGFPSVDSTEAGRLPDLVFELSPDYYAVTGEGSGILVGPSAMRSMHGYGPGLPAMDGFLACRGPGFAEGATAETASVLDIAPMVNRLYGLGMEGMDGAVPERLLRRRA
jgi:predicted AlkP superfamily pyrophosphatase or phosphodiesterase